MYGLLFSPRIWGPRLRCGAKEGDERGRVPITSPGIESCRPTAEDEGGEKRNSLRRWYSGGGAIPNRATMGHPPPPGPQAATGNKQRKGEGLCCRWLLPS
ncbi:hypothetical protein MRX96_013020 [Rhipicephalus microplus]